MNKKEIINNKWYLPTVVEAGKSQLFETNKIVTKILYRRGFNHSDDVNDFLIPKDLPNSFDHFSELKKAVQKISKSCKENKQIAICGDYDCDGITSTAVLVNTINAIGGEAIPFIPTRKEDGYGLNIKMLKKIHGLGIQTLITVDNGVSAIEAIAMAKKLNIDVIITDHHHINNPKLDVFALIHPELTPE